MNFMFDLPFSVSKPELSKSDKKDPLREITGATGGGIRCKNKNLPIEGRMGDKNTSASGG